MLVGEAWTAECRGVLALEGAVMSETRPLFVIEGDGAQATARLAEVIGLARADGWWILRGWGAPMRRDRVVCTGWIRSADDARRALLAAVAGAGLAVAAATDRETTDRFLDDLRRLGAVDHETAAVAEAARPAPQQRALLGLLAEGLSIDEAATELGMSRRAADRRVAAARRASGR
jgi:hypothetical protein